MKTFKSVLFLLSGLSFSLSAQQTKGLKDYYRDYFVMGVAVAPRHLDDGPESKLILQHFGSLTAENVMKSGPIHPREGVYNWEPADKIVDYAQMHKLKVRGHTLCWHSQTPPWFFKDDKGEEVSKAVLLKRLEDHIMAVAGRYKGRIYAWDVVNEAVPDTGTGIYRESLFYKILGEEYLQKAFEFAHKADPEALLFYNDYNTESKSKREKIFTLVKALKDKGVPIHGVGLQGHWSVYEPSAQQLEESILKFASLGLKVQITELDVSVYPKEHGRRTKKDTDTGIFTPEQEQMQVAQYKMIFGVLRKHRDKVTGVTFWNISDKSSWLDNFPVPGRKDYPLLFDTNFQPKKAFWEVVRF